MKYLKKILIYQTTSSFHCNRQYNLLFSFYSVVFLPTNMKFYYQSIFFEIQLVNVRISCSANSKTDILPLPFHLFDHSCLSLPFQSTSSTTHVFLYLSTSTTSHVILYLFISQPLLSFSTFLPPLPLMSLSLGDSCRAQVCLLSSVFLLLTLLLFFYVIPLYDCQVCSYFNCLPLTKDFCATQNINFKREETVV